MKENCKEIAQEYSIVRSSDSNVISLYRFPNSIKNFRPSEVRYKPISKHTEIKASFPPKNTSALKTKMLNASAITYTANPVELKSHYYTKVEGNKIVLYKVQNSYIFQPLHEYHPFEYQASKTKKAESREEFEHRMRNINFKLKKVDEEDFKTMSFSDSACIKSHSNQDDSVVDETTKREVGNKEDKTIEDQNDKTDELNKEMQSSTLKRIEKTVHNSRICNFSDLLKIYSDAKLLKSVLFRMTQVVAGRCILKNSYYERSLHGMRSQLMKLFEESDVIEKKETEFLKGEEWLVKEIATQEGHLFRLKGYREEIELSSAHAKEIYLSLIKDVFATSRIMSIAEIASKISLDEAQVSDLISKNPLFIHLSNNSYAINDESYWLNDLFLILKNKKSFELAEIEERLNEKQIQYKIFDLQNEIKKYCTLRGSKYCVKASAK